MTALALSPVAVPANADGPSKLEASYRATLAGLPIGGGSWVVDIDDDQYSMTVNAQANGLLRVFAGGDGTGAIRGTINGSRVTPTSYAFSIRTKDKLDEVRMALAAGSVKRLSVEPPVRPNPKRIPLTEAHKRGVVDPVSAGLVVRLGDTLGPESCRRTVHVFDGRHRFDLALSFKRMERVKAEQGYEGPALVCAVRYHPIGGYHEERFANQYLAKSRDIEIWYAPIAGTRFLAAYRIALPTAIGQAVLQATRFVAIEQGRRSGALKTRTQ
ncbi:MAG TPA: DUF3108 domain-containing protein [Xanthobacteraceae bacterium]|nr:DUF3108 domain-containing protein [Xanthobacteraceae bacterium]